MTLGTIPAAKKVGSEVVEGIFKQQTPAKRKIAAMIESGEGGRDTAKYMLTPEGKVVTDPLAKKTISQGFDEGVIAAVKNANPIDREKMRQMVDVMQNAKGNARYAMTNRPSDIAGESLIQRFDFVLDTNKQAGKELDIVANGLKGQSVDFSPAVDNFINDLDSLGVKLNRNLTPNFRGSDIEGNLAAEKVISNIVKRMRTNYKNPDAYEVHRLKRYIDDQVTYGKSAEGLAGRSESVLKSLRANLDKVLDESFPDYNNINTRYSDTISAIDALQDVAGKKMDLTADNASKATGTLLRRLMSNAQSRVNLLDAINDIENVGNKYGAGFEDDLLNQVLFVDELDRVFGPVARTSLQGQMKQSLEGAASFASESALEKTARIVGKAAEKAKGVTEETQFEAIKELLK